MFHILSYVVDGTIQTPQDFHDWYKKTLHSTQGNHIDLKKAEMVLNNLMVRYMITKKDGKFCPTRIGEITSKMYMSPLDVSDWFNNFSKIKKLHPEMSDDRKTKEDINLSVDLRIISML